MIGVTADANIYISGLEFGGLPEQFLQLARDGAFRLDISESLKREVLRVLREKFVYPTQALLATEAQIDRITHRVNPTQQLEVIKTDPSDNRILELRGCRKERFHCQRRYAPCAAGWQLCRNSNFKACRFYGTPEPRAVVNADRKRTFA